MSTRLDQLLDLRRQIDVEIERERIAAARALRLRRTALAAMTRGTWSTRVFNAACEHFSVAGDDILGPRMTRYILDARHVVMWLLHDSGRSYSEIGRELGKDHTTVRNACERVERRPDLLAVAAEVRSLLTEEEAA